MEKDWQRRQKDMEREMKETKDQMQNLEEENKRLLDTLVRHSKVKAQGATTSNLGITTGGEIVRSVSSSSIG
jgi:hypothetical protein